MKPKDLKPVFQTHDPQVMLEDRIWYVPSRVPQDFAFSGFDDPKFFLQNLPICLEVCSGNGSWIAQKAIDDPKKNYLALEMKWKRIRKIWSKIQNHDLMNLLGICGEAYHVIKTYFLPDSIEEVYINFPDPWPKKRHAKHRILRQEFLQELYRVLKPQGRLCVVTDDTNYSDAFTQIMLELEGFACCDPDPFWVSHWPDYGCSYFEQLWRSKGKEIRYHRWIKS